MSVKRYLAERGLCFLSGVPPQTESGVLLVWLGGCNAVLAMWRRGRLVAWNPHVSGVGKPLPLDHVECWMRLPHPSFWPMMPPPAALMAERELYAPSDSHNPAEDVIDRAEGAGAETREASAGGPQIVCCGCGCAPLVSLSPPVCAACRVALDA